MPNNIDESDYVSDIHRWLRLQPVDDRKSYHSVSSSDATTSRCEVDGHELAEALQNVEELQFPLEIRSSKSFGSGYWTPPIATPGACRICWQPDSDDENKCITPCHCCGSISKVHRSCLEKWLRQSGTSQCEICLYQYTIKRVKKYSLLESIKAWWNSSEKQEEVEELCTDVRVFCLSFPFMCGLTYAGSVVTDHILRLDAQGYLVAFYQMSSFGIFSAILTADFFYGFWAAWQGTHHFTNWLDFNRDSLLVTVVDDKSAE